MTITSNIWYVECSNPQCLLRFPLDLAQFKGSYCPRCGSPLTQMVRASGQPTRVSPCLTKGYHLVAVLDNIRSIHNVGAIFRSADGAGLAKILLCGITPTPKEHPELSKTALGAQWDIPWEYHPNTPALIRALKAQGALILALENLESAKPLANYHLAALQTREVVLVVGSEPAGIDPEVLALADDSLFLPMAGQKGSLNVSVAFGIASYWLQFAKDPAG
ncbi:MAG: TrmH family RNA methyltransferase [Anaerolineaceae bacterium]